MPNPSDGGLAHFQRRLKGITEKAEAGIRAAMEKSATEIVAVMKHLCPVDRGDLRDSIGWTWGDAPEGATVLGSVGGSSGSLKITIYAGSKDVFWAGFVEFGHRTPDGGHVPAHPFFYPAWRQNRKRVTGRARRALRKAVKESANA